MSITVWGAGFRVQGSGFRVQDSGIRVQGAGCRVQGSGFRVQDPGSRVQGSSVPPIVTSPVWVRELADPVSLVRTPLPFHCGLGFRV